MQRTPLFHHHQQRSGRMVEFAGWEMPIQYVGAVAEHYAVRHHAGLFDVSHMGEFVFRGKDASTCLQQLTTNDVSRLVPSRAHYSLLLNEQGGVVDDIIIYCYSEEHFVIVVNAANIEKDWHWIMAHQRGVVKVTNESQHVALIALQGPAADAILQPFVECQLSALERFQFAAAHCAGKPVTISRTGYTGSPGFELFMSSEDAGAVWGALLEQGQVHRIQPCGLAARDILRIEVGYPLYGHEITDTTTPWEAGLGWVVKMECGDFIGRDALVARQAEVGPRRRLIGLRMIDPSIPREGCAIVADTKPIGFITSGTMSPLLKQGIGMAYVPTTLSAVGTKICVDIRGRERIAEVTKIPFVQPPATVATEGTTI